MQLNPVKKIVYTAVCCALCLILPMAFHSVPKGGIIFLPMHIPVLLCGLVCGWQYGLICGVLGPLLSSIVTSMPPAAILPSMTVECGVYGLVSGLLMKYVHTKHMAADIYISMISSMILGRVVAGFAKAWIFTPGVSPFAWVTTSLVTGIPGIVLQLVLMPALIYALTKAKLIPARYEDSANETTANH